MWLLTRLWLLQLLVKLLSSHPSNSHSTSILGDLGNDNQENMTLFLRLFALTSDKLSKAKEQWPFIQLEISPHLTSAAFLSK
jgi:hypothetical protein